MSIRPGIVPCLVYDDAPAAIEFLCAAFGFTRHLIVAGNAGQIMHAQLILGDACMVMLSSATPRSREQFRMVSPVSTGGLVTATICVTLADPDAHHARAAAAGARVFGAPHDNDYGGRGYEVFDTEGSVWSFASYDPWTA
jgi:uncharacterized glyoxalase superfamily protein PhnB